MRAREFLREAEAAVAQAAASPATPAPGAFSVDTPKGNKGAEVADLQKALVALGYPLPRFGVDGIKGPETSAAVRKFQQDNQLKVDGIPGPDTVSKLNAILSSKSDVVSKLTKSTQADVKPGSTSPASNGTSSTRTYGGGTIPPLDVNDENMAAAKESAEKFLGSPLDDQSWNYLIRATSAEASNDTEEQAWVMGVILNRVRSGRWGNSVMDVLYARNQFQAVTGTKVNPGPSPHFTKGPTKQKLGSILKGAIEILPTVNKNTMNFTAANSAAYGPGTNIGFRDTMVAKGGIQIGQTVFGTA